MKIEYGYSQADGTMSWYPFGSRSMVREIARVHGYTFLSREVSEEYKVEEM